MTTTRTPEKSHAAPQPIYRKDYRAPDYLIDTVDLRFELSAGRTLVRSRLTLERNQGAEPGARPLVLRGSELELLSVQLNGQLLGPDHYQLSEETLTLPEVPESFTLEIECATDPAGNTALEGLYKTKGSAYCTQCEAEGFRRITYFPRPAGRARALHDDASRRTKTSYPVLLSNGNRVDSGDARGRPPLGEVGGPLSRSPATCSRWSPDDLELPSRDSFTVRTLGRDVRNWSIYVEPEQNVDKCEHAMLRRSRSRCSWDEEVFGLEPTTSTST